MNIEPALSFKILKAVCKHEEIRNFDAAQEAVEIVIKEWLDGAMDFDLTKTQWGFREWCDSGMGGTMSPTHKAKLVCIEPISSPACDEK